MPWLRNIPTQDLAAVRSYTSGFIKTILNVPLKTISLSEDSASPEVASAVERAHLLAPILRGICSGLNALPAFRGPTFRGVEIAPEMLLRRYPVDAEVQENFFLSTATKPEKAWAGNVRFRIESKSGRDISFLSTKPQELEVLFAPGCRFRVMQVTKNPPKNNDRYDRAYEVVLREI